MKTGIPIYLLRQFILLMLCILPLQNGYTTLVQDRFGEYMVKMAYTLNFARLTQWPKHKQTKTINICVMGNELLKSTFYQVNGKNINGYSAHLKILSRLRDIKACKLLFISGIKHSNMRQIFKLAQQHSILTISELPDIRQSGAMLNFVYQNHKVRFQVDPVKARQAGLKISSRLLKLSVKNQFSAHHNQ